MDSKAVGRELRLNYTHPDNDIKQSFASLVILCERVVNLALFHPVIFISLLFHNERQMIMQKQFTFHAHTTMKLTNRISYHFLLCIFSFIHIMFKLHFFSLHLMQKHVSTKKMAAYSSKFNKITI